MDRDGPRAEENGRQTNFVFVQPTPIVVQTAAGVHRHRPSSFPLRHRQRQMRLQQQRIYPPALPSDAQWWGGRWLEADVIEDNRRRPLSTHIVIITSIAFAPSPSDLPLPALVSDFPFFSMSFSSLLPQSLPSIPSLCEFLILCPSVAIASLKAFWCRRHFYLLQCFPQIFSPV